MLFLRSRAWTVRQRWLITGIVVVGVVALYSMIYAYERYYRGPSEAALFGTWEDTTPAIDSNTYYRFRSNGTFDILADALGEPLVVTTGTWYAGGPNIYWRLSEDFVPEIRRPLIWHIVDISPNEVRVRPTRDGPICTWKRVNLKASNQSLQPTASRRE
jgi:hypothetical protein